MRRSLIDIKTKLELIDWDFVDSSTSSANNIHPYPAKFISEIPRKLLEVIPINRNSIVLDPFCGSGVTLIEARNKGYNSIGVDLNPIACLISRVRLNPIPLQFKDKVQEIIIKSKDSGYPIEVPKIQNLDHWFVKDVQLALTQLSNQISHVTDINLKDALSYCLSSIIVRVSNQESDTRYAAINKKVKSADVFRYFELNAQKLIDSKKDERSLNKDFPTSQVLNMNSLNLTECELGKNIGCVITSPPYPNAYEYWLYHKYRMWWLGYDPIDVKRMEIGARAHYFKKEFDKANDFRNQMNKLFITLHDNMLNESFMSIVIGRSKIHGEIIQNETIIKETAEELGYKHLTTLRRRINASRKSFNLMHARIKDEYIVVLYKD